MASRRWHPLCLRQVILMTTTAASFSPSLSSLGRHHPRMASTTNTFMAKLQTLMSWPKALEGKRHSTHIIEHAKEEVVR